jgi:ribA/ribD-fused uncharacterized protein
MTLRAGRRRMIDRFIGEHRFLSNFHAAPVWLEDQLYPTVENAYQAAKTLNADLRRQFHSVSPVRAHRLGRRLELRPDWAEVRLTIMLGLLRQKFRIPELCDRLLATGDHVLVEGNSWGDTFWGTCRGTGENHLGRLLMQVRSELAEKPSR